MLVFAAFSSVREKRRRAAILRRVSEERDGTLDVNGVFGDPSVTVRFHDGIEMKISMFTREKKGHTEYKIIVPAPGLPTFKLGPPGVTDRVKVALAIGLRDITVGVKGFDEAFVLEGRDAGAIERVWSEARARQMAGAFASSRIECEGAVLRLLQPVIESAAQVDLGIALLLELARSDPYGQHVLADLPEGSLRKTDDGFYEVELPGPSRIFVGPQEWSGYVRTCAWTAAIGAVSTDAETQVTALGATLEQTETELRICWPSVEADVRRLTAAVDLLRRLATGPQLGVFR